MGTVGLTLRWEHRISPVAGEGGRRVETSEFAARQKQEENISDVLENIKQVSQLVPDLWNRL